MKFSIYPSALILLAGFFLATPMTQAQTVLPIPQPGHYRPVWNQYLPINVYHSPARRNNTTSSIGNVYNAYQPQMAFGQNTGIAIPQTSRVMPILATDFQSVAAPPIEHVIVNASDLPFQPIPMINVVDSWSSNSPQNVQLGFDSLITNDQIPQGSPSDMPIDPGTGPGQPSQATYEEPLTGFIAGEVVIADSTSKSESNESESQRLADSNVEQDLKIEPQNNDAPNETNVQTAQSVEINQSRKEAMKDELERQILLAIKQKQEDKAASIKLDRIKEQMDQLQDVNSKQNASGRSIKEKRNEKSSAETTLGSDKMTLARLAEQKRRERDQDATKVEESEAKAQQRLDNLESEMEAQMIRSVEKIRTRFQKKMDRAAKLNNGNEKVMKLENEMNVQVEKMKNRIVNRFRRRIEAARRATEQ